MQYRTDLAMERAADHPDIPGVQVINTQAGDYARCEVRIESEEAARQLQKPCGRYITFEIPPLHQMAQPARAELAQAIADTLQSLMPPEGDVLIVGLGNRRITSDKLGSQVVETLLVTRHLRGHLSQPLLGRLRGVCALAPGVLGVTGMETADLVQGAAEHARPCAIIAIDALSARECRRIGAVIQVTDTGIQPGSGVGNHRAGITRETMGVPVIAVGVPTVVYGSVIIRDALRQILGDYPDASEREAAADALAQRILSQPLGEMVVTPREIDQLVAELSQVIGMSLNLALQPQLSREEILMLTNEAL